MRHREPEAPITYQERPYIVNNPRIADAIKKRLGNQWVDVSEFSELELYHLELEVRLQRKISLYNPETAEITSVPDPWIQPHLYTTLWNERRPKLLAPVDTSPTADFVEAWSQPEAVALLDEWWHPEIPDRYQDSHEAAKAVLVIAGGMGCNLKEAHDDLEEKHRLKEHFSKLAAKTKRSKRNPKVPPMRRGDYSAMTRLLPRLARTFPVLAMQTNIEIIKELRRLRPELGIGEVAAVDGSLIPYWCPQMSAKEKGVLNEKKEARFNRGYERCGFVALGYDADGQFSDRDKAMARKKKIKSCRGGRFVLLVESVTGLPLVGVLLPANCNEVAALYELMPMLYGYWNDCPLQAIVGDKLYDQRDAHQFLETRYGVHPIASRKPSLVEKGFKVVQKKNSPIQFIDGRGTAYCHEHGHAFEVENVEVPNRAKEARTDGTIGLLPGDEAPEGKFRYRYRDFTLEETDKEWCGRPTLPMSFDWSQLAYYPHNGVGGPRAKKRYHERLVLESIARNQSEGAFASLQTGYGLGTDGADRPRVKDDYVYESLIWAALLTRSLKMLADQRAWVAGQNGNLAAAA